MSDTMNRENNPEKSLSPDFFILWTPASGRTVGVGPEKSAFELPQIPLPLHRKDAQKEEPSDDDVGTGVYDYLRQFPDCPYNHEYARLLQEAFPHYLAEIGSQVVMLDAREVDPLYIRRKIRLLKILLLLEPQNAGLLQQLGMACYEVGMMFSELPLCRLDLLQALGFFQKALALNEDLRTLNYLAQIDYLLGDYPAAARRWQGVVERLPEGVARQELQRRLDAIGRDDVPSHPLVDDLEQIGQAVDFYNDGDTGEALDMMENLAEDEYLLSFYRTPEFLHFLGLCREKEHDLKGAATAFSDALKLENSYEPAVQGLERVTAERH